MALIYIPTDHIKLRKSISFEKKPILMLKDYLRDDLSSCSSSGFKSFPRRQCCTTVRFLLEADLKKSKDYSSATKRLLKRSRSKPISTTFAALQRASEAILNAVKLLPFASVKSSSPLLQSNSSRKGLLTRSFSRKLFKRSFWRKSEKEDGEIKRWKLFREFLEEKNRPSDENKITNVNTTDTSSTIIASRVSTSTSSNSNNCPQSEFTPDVLPSSTGNSENSNENDVVESKTTSLEKENVGNIVGVTGGQDSISYTKGIIEFVEGKVGEENSWTWDRIIFLTCGVFLQNDKEWQNEEGKEQFSPVSVLDCPFDDEEDNPSPNNFQDQLARVEGTKQKLMQKIRRFDFENLQAQLEPLDLEKRIALSELQHESLCRLSVTNNGNLSAEEKQQKLNSETKLLKLFKTKIPSESLTFKADNLLLDFFREKMEEDNAKLHVYMGLEEFGLDLFTVAEDWINGNLRELVLGWESQERRTTYLKEMERNQNWRNFDEEKENVGLQIELEVLSLLVNEILIDLF